MLEKISFIESLEISSGIVEGGVHVCSTRFQCKGLHRPQLASGRGQTQTQARQGCIGEAIEAWCTTWDEALPNRWAHSGSVTLDTQEQHLAMWSDMSLLPEGCAPQALRSVLQGQSLQDLEPVPIPEACVYWDHPLAKIHGIDVVHSSVGVAAGTSETEARLDATLELVEQDAVAIWQRTEAPFPRVPTQQLLKPHIARLAGALALQGYRLVFLDLTTDLDIPVVAALAVERDENIFAVGSAAAQTLEVAISKANSELAMAVAAKHIDEATRDVIGESIAHDTRRPALSVPPSRQLKQRSLRHVTSAADVYALLKDRGHSVYAINLTDREIGVPVVKVVATGLCRLSPSSHSARAKRIAEWLRRQH